MFFSLLNAKVNLDIAIKNHADYDTLYNVSKGRFQLGKISEADLLKIEIQKLQSENNLSDARVNYDDVLFKFKSFLRISNIGNIHLVPPKEVFKLDVDVQKAVELAKRNTTQALDLELNELNTEKALEQAKRERNPGVNLNASYGLSNTAGKLEDIYKDPIKSQGLTIGISMPILDWGRRKGRYKIAEYKYKMDKADQEQKRIDFEQDVRLKVIKFSKLNDRLIIASKKNVIAQKSFELTQKRYMIGKIQDIRKLTEAQQEYDRAQNEYYNEIKNFWVQYFSLRKLTLYDFKENKMIDVDFDKLQ
ncbi:MAG: TolC family protein [Clostridia bacterium]|nr:TolC family protein [Clostridia bacterium]